MSFDFAQDAREALEQEGLPYMIVQFRESEAMYMWDFRYNKGDTGISRETMVNELRVLADGLEAGIL